MRLRLPTHIGYVHVQPASPVHSSTSNNVELEYRVLNGSMAFWCFKCRRKRFFQDGWCRVGSLANVFPPIWSFHSRRVMQGNIFQTEEMYFNRCILHASCIKWSKRGPEVTIDVSIHRILIAFSIPPTTVTPVFFGRASCSLRFAIRLPFTTAGYRGQSLRALRA